MFAQYTILHHFIPRRTGFEPLPRISKPRSRVLLVRSQLDLLDRSYVAVRSTDTLHSIIHQIQ